MATLAFGLIFFFLIRSAEGLTGGNNGIGGIPLLSVGPWQVTGDERMFLLAWLIMTLGLLLARNIVDSRTGRALRALGSSEVAAGCCGVNVARAKVAVFVTGAMYASLAGSLYALYVTYISPEAFGVLVSIQFLVISTVGGLTSVWGAPVGAAFLVLLTELTREVVPIFVEGATGSYELVAYGLALVIVLLVFKQGIAGIFTRWDGPRRRPATAFGRPTREAPERRASRGKAAP
jgi:branched-chain amino acid transport system permease protein